jgi:hypothetical protein
MSEGISFDDLLAALTAQAAPEPEPVEEFPPFSDGEADLALLTSTYRLVDNERLAKLADSFVTAGQVTDIVLALLRELAPKEILSSLLEPLHEVWERRAKQRAALATEIERRKQP